MTKKHYEAIAAIIASTYNNAKLYPTDTIVSPCESIATIAARLADYFATENKNFDRTRFLQACGIVEINYHAGASYKDCATVEQLKNIDSKHYGGCSTCGYTGR